MPGSFRAQRIIPVIAVLVGLGVALRPLVGWLEWNDCQSRNAAAAFMYQIRDCGLQPQPDWFTGLLVGIVAYFVLAGFVVAQGALGRSERSQP